MGIGISNALDSFNIGRTGAQNSSIGMAIRDIVAQGDKLATVQGQASAQGAASIATEQYKNMLANRPQDVIVQNPDGSFTTIKDVKGGSDSVVKGQAYPTINSAVGSTMVKKGTNEVLNAADLSPYNAGAPADQGALQQFTPGATPAPAATNYSTGGATDVAAQGGLTQEQIRQLQEAINSRQLQLQGQ